MNYKFKIEMSCKYLFVLLFTFSSACFLNSYTPATGNLLNDELVGEWKPTEESIAFLRKENICCEDKEIKLTLSVNNTFELKNMPDCWRNDFGECRGAIFSYKGTWSINQRKGSDNWLHLFVQDSSQRGIYALPIIKRKGKIQIAFVFGDPDDWREIYLTRK
jgi:hypothetical protein